MNGKFVTYYRVSTDKQGKSKLGLEAQQATILQYLNGGSHEVLGEFIEVETGKGSNALSKRPELSKAIELCKKTKAKLLISKLDRLSRNVHFITSLMEAKVKFVCADMPEANELTIHLLSAVAQYERELISKRTKDALQALKARGVKLGNPNLHIDNTKRINEAQSFAESLRPTIKGYQLQGMTQRQMVGALNQSGVKTPSGKGEWSLVQAQRVIKRLAA